MARIGAASQCFNSTKTPPPLGQLPAQAYITVTFSTLLERQRTALGLHNFPIFSSKWLVGDRPVNGAAGRKVPSSKLLALGLP